MTPRRGVAAAVVVAALVLGLAWCRGGDTRGVDPAPSPTSGVPVGGDVAPTTSTGGAVDLPAPTTVAPTPPPTALPTKPTPTPPPTTRVLFPVEVAKRWTAAACQYTWRDPYGQREARQAVWSSPRLVRAELTPTPAGRAEWKATVVHGRVESRCRVDAAIVMAAAPNTATRTHVRVAVTTVVARFGVRPVQSPGYWPVRVINVGGKWAVDGLTAGG